MNRILSLFFFFSLSCFSFAQNEGHILLKTAKFKTGDDKAWTSPAFTDTGWKDVKVGEVWQSQGFRDYHGYAWYRIHVVIPSDLKNKAHWKDSLRLYLAHVNDVDETFLNGVKIGQIGSFPDQPQGYESKWPFVRQYQVAVGNPAILWDKENIISIRVYDGGGSGGIFMGTPYIDMLEKFDGMEMTSGEVRFMKDNTAKKELVLKNNFNTDLGGSLYYKVYNAATEKVIEEKTQSVNLGPFASKTIAVTFPHTQGIEVVYEYDDYDTKNKKQVKQITPYLLTPPTPAAVKINGPSVFGVRPASPFLYKIPATGKAPIKYDVKNLPAGLKVDAQTGIISGVLNSRGEFKVVLTGSNDLGNDSKTFTIHAGDILALSPPMGWNSWNCWGLSVSDTKVRSSAQAMIDKGLVNHGWTYMNIDDGWEAAKRTDNGEMVPNEKFPDMKGLSNYLHNNGMRLGIYSSPGPTTCGGFLGSYQHEAQDASMYAKWGIDYLKYDWCSYSSIIPRQGSLDDYQKPYIIMRDALKQQQRDIVYSLCQYGMQDVWIWGPEVNGNLWRTTGDITDTWESLYRIGFSQDRSAPYSKPGGWNDPDMLIVGRVGWGENLHPTGLTPHEQYTHISLWSLLSAPLLIGCDMSKLDAFTLNLLTNEEVLSIDQDPLGKGARQVIKNDTYQVWVKDLQDGSKAIGVFNMSSKYQTVDLKWSDIKLSGSVKVRDVWRQKNLGVFNERFSSLIPSHGVMLIKISVFRR